VRFDKQVVAVRRGSERAPITENILAKKQ